MKKTFLVLTAIVALVTGAAVAPAHAVIVQLWTEASLDGGPFSSSNSYTMWPGLGGVEFNGLTGVFVDTSGTFSLGTFNVFGDYGATYSSTPNPLPFTIKITDANGSGPFDGSVSGSFGGSWSALVITIPATDVLIGDSVYRVAGLNTTLSFDPQSVDAVPTPEPSTLLLMGTGLTGLVGAVRRKISRRKVVQGPGAAQ